MDITLMAKDNLEETEYTGMHPKKFALWLAMASMTMFFASLTSALLVKKGDFTVWENFRLPEVFLYSTFTIIVMSVVLQYSLYSYRHTRFTTFRITLLLSFLLGLLFLTLQLVGWYQLKAMGMTLTGTVSASFIYLITAMHGAHIIGGLIAMMFFYFYMIWQTKANAVFEGQGKVNPSRQLHLELLVGYWHYVDAVWLYLYIFFRLNYQ